jgi:hypothetical protein
MTDDVEFPAAGAASADPGGDSGGMTGETRPWHW